MNKLEIYKAQIRSLFPRGKLWTFIPGGVLDSLITGIAQEFIRIDDRAADLIRESDPRTTVELLPDWERVMGLPGVCGNLAENDDERRNQVVAKLIQAGPQNKAFFAALAQSLGYDVDVEDIFEFLPFRAEMSRAEEYLAEHEDWPHTFLIKVNTVSLRYFRAETHRAEDRLVEFGDALLECLVNESKPAHSIALFEYPAS